MRSFLSALATATLLMACSSDDAGTTPDAGTSSSSGGGGSAQPASFPKKYHAVGAIHVDAPGQSYDATMEMDFAQNSEDSDTLATFAGTGGTATYETPITYGKTGRSSTAAPDHGTLDPAAPGTLSFAGALGAAGSTVSLAAAITWTATVTYTGPAASDNEVESGPSLIGSVCNASSYAEKSGVLTVDCPRNDSTATYVDTWTLTPVP